ncbi:hypothetical protein KUCAC02_006922 [Chaenocephalus aceratus]|uniref:Uncharacterized protein n=1 Tax=Chaenocephalus aceratus TaxID=36190 RepID=A0ACB9VT99_CHAAC|nr:hypothetical protein KUCAC02_006922 [Chaenocephalus aceratus]
MDGCPSTPLFTFGVIADIQYADLEDGFNYSRTRKRFYRSSLQLLKNAQRSWAESAVRPEFILQLGDIIDGFNKGHGASERALDTVLREFSVPAEVHHVWGQPRVSITSAGARCCVSRLNSSALHRDRDLSGDVYAY